MKALLAGMLLLSFLLVACDSADPGPIRPFDYDTLTRDTSLLVGTWDLAWTGGFFGPPQGPPTGALETLVLSQDSTFTYTVDGEVTHSGRFSMGSECNQDTEVCHTTLELEGWFYPSRAWSGVSEEWLVFNDFIYDGSLSAFQRR